MGNNKLQVYTPLEVQSLREYYAKDAKIEVLISRSKYVNSLSVQSIVESNRQAICEFQNTELAKGLTSTISRIINDLQECCKVTNKLSVNEIYMIAYDLVNNDEFNQLTIDDIVLIMNRIRTGFYGHLYNSLDTIKVFDFIRRYIKEKEEVRQNYDYFEKQRKKSLKWHYDNVIKTIRDYNKFRICSRDIYDKMIETMIIRYKNGQTKDLKLMDIDEYIEFTNNIKPIN